MEVNQAKLRLYKFLVDNGRMTIEDVPEPYKSALVELYASLNGGE